MHRTTLFLTTLTLAAGCADEPAPPSSAPALAAAPTSIVPPAPSVPRARPVECLTDEHGLLLRAQVTRPSVRASARADGGGPGDELAFFTPFYFVFERASASAGEAFLLGRTPRRDSLVGWCPGDAVALWSTSVGMAGRAVVYKSVDDIAALIRTGKTRDPIAISDPAASKKPFLLPVAETRTIQVDGADHEVWRVHFVGRRKPDAPTPYTATERAQHQSALRQLDCFWVVDATGSMAPFWDAAKKALAGMARRIAQGSSAAHADVRFGLVAYRDHDAGSGFVTRVVPPCDERAFLAALEAIAPSAGGDTQEAGLDALHAALASTWRPGELSTRVAFLVSDASFHEDGSNNPAKHTRASIALRAKELGVRVLGLAVGQASMTDDRALQAAQNRDLAARTGGASLAIEQADEAVARIEAILAEAAQQIVRREAVYAAVTTVGATPAALSAETGLALEQVTDVLEFLASHIDVAKLAPGEVAFASGWVLPVWKGKRALELRVLASSADCELLRDACRRMICDLSLPRAASLVAVGVRGRALASLVADERADVAAHLAARYGVPARADSVLRLSQVAIDHMSEQERSRRLDAVALGLQRLWDFEHDDRNWFTGAEGRVAFVPEEVLP